ncbi:hypothetical protein U9M48_032327 [Paspalum notatum var. saurae]|uniref:Uncharacterized protein n=1 Tax=Paspalum notatum var. saurae TaxID=547442 RepID=A0AAQ3X5B6_PASNO
MAAATDRVHDDAARRRALLDATTPGRSLAVGRCKVALDTFRNEGNLHDARTLLLDALACSNVHHPTIFRAWISMEEEARSDAAGVRKLFEAWRCSYLGGGLGHDEGGFWCHYIDFELRHGTAASVRSVAERAVAACPRDPAVHAKYAKAELRMGCPDRASAVLLSALDLFAADAKSREWLEREVTTYRDAMGHGSWRRLRGLLPFCRRRPSGLAPGYRLLGIA